MRHPTHRSDVVSCSSRPSSRAAGGADDRHHRRHRAGHQRRRRCRRHRSRSRTRRTGLTRTAVTGARAATSFAALPPARYELRAELAGFKPHMRPELELAVAETLALNITLQVGDAGIEEVVVGHDAAGQHLQLGAELSRRRPSTIEQLPLNGRNYTDLALLQPGVTRFRIATAARSSRTGSA